MEVKPISRGYIMRYSCKTIIIIAVLSVLLVASISPTRAGFVLASWEYPDEYGQGIYDFDVYENSTGSWVNVGGPTEYDESNIFEWEIGVAIKLKAWSYFNSTLTGAATTNEGKNYQRHNVTVTSLNGTTVFSQQNFTYSNVYTEEAPMWVYVYEVVLDFLPDYGEYYTVTVIYEIFWGDAWHTLPAAQLWFDTPDWTLINVASIWFVVFDLTALWGLDTLFIIIGLIMIPASTMYLVRGGKEKLSSDKVFFALVLFFMGCALFLGGIMP